MQAGLPTKQNLSIFAVVIGINKYASSSPDYPNLNGASEDADRFNNYLTHKMGVPSDNIYSLRDEKASREGITKSILWLKSHPAIKKNKTAIVIYFAGHGARTKSKVQMICPSDINTEMTTKNGHTVLVPGISGKALAKHFRDLSRTKGNNITIFLDCCHSTGMINPKIAIRGRYPKHRGADILPVSTILVDDWEQYTVITACGSDMKAYERASVESGVFTSRLLDVLSAPNSEYLTYVSLMHQLQVGEMPVEQIAHCEGSRLHRTLYNLYPSLAGDPSLVFTRRLQSGSIVLHAGSVHGIVKGLKLSMFANNLANPRGNPCLGELVAGSVEEFTSYLLYDSFADSQSKLPSYFYCKISDSSMRKNTVLYSSEKSWLESVFSLDLQSQLALNIAGEDSNYDLRLDVINGRVQFRQSTKLITSFVDPCMGEPVKKEDTQKIRRVVQRFVHFYSHLELDSRQKFRKIDVEVELNELSRGSEKGSDVDFLPANKSLLDGDQVHIAASQTKLYGLTVRNFSKVKLYPYIFFFDPMDLTIRAIYQPPTASGEYGSTNKTDSPLPPSSELTIGYGSSVFHGHSFRFCSPPGNQAAIAHIRLYLSSCPTSFESMIRKTSPFTDAIERSVVIESQDNSPLQNRWIVKTTTFILA